jgi:hypothetical protein
MRNLWVRVGYILYLAGLVVIAWISGPHTEVFWVGMLGPVALGTMIAGTLLDDAYPDRFSYAMTCGVRGAAGACFAAIVFVLVFAFMGADFSDSLVQFFVVFMVVGFCLGALYGIRKA